MKTNQQLKTFKQEIFSLFSLKIEIPSNSLIPKINQRKSYLEWISKLHFESNPVLLDIGCGYSCILSLLFYKIYNGTAIATDCNLDSVEFSIQNCELNKITQIKPILTNKTTILPKTLKNEYFTFIQLEI